MAAPAAAHSMWKPITASLVDMLLSESIRMFSIRLFAAVHGPAMYSSLVSVLCPVRCQLLAALYSATVLGDCRHHKMWGGATSCSSVDVGSLGLFVVIIPCAARAQGMLLTYALLLLKQRGACSHRAATGLLVLCTPSQHVVLSCPSVRLLLELVAC